MNLLSLINPKMETHPPHLEQAKRQKPTHFQPNRLQPSSRKTETLTEKVARGEREEEWNGSRRCGVRMADKFKVWSEKRAVGSRSIESWCGKRCVRWEHGQCACRAECRSCLQWSCGGLRAVPHMALRKGGAPSQLGTAHSDALPPPPFSTPSVDFMSSNVQNSRNCMSSMKWFLVMHVCIPTDFVDCGWCI